MPNSIVLVVLVSLELSAICPSQALVLDADPPGARQTSNFSSLIQPNCPAGIDRIELDAHGTVWVFLSNRSKLRVVKARLGWFVLWPNGTVNTSLGRSVKIPLDPRKAGRISGAPLSQKSYPAAPQVLIFVASVDFHKSQSWNEDILRLKAAVINTYAYKIRLVF